MPIGGEALYTFLAARPYRASASDEITGQVTRAVLRLPQADAPARGEFTH